MSNMSYCRFEKRTVLFDSTTNLSGVHRSIDFTKMVMENFPNILNAARAYQATISPSIQK